MKNILSGCVNFFFSFLFLTYLFLSSSCSEIVEKETTKNLTNSLLFTNATTPISIKSRNFTLNLLANRKTKANTIPTTVTKNNSNVTNFRDLSYSRQEQQSAQRKPTTTRRPNVNINLQAIVDALRNFSLQLTTTKRPRNITITTVRPSVQRPPTNKPPQQQRPTNRPSQQQRPTNRPPQPQRPLTTRRPPNIPTSSPSPNKPSTSQLNITQTSQRPRPGLNEIDVQTKNPNLSMATPTKVPINSTQTNVRNTTIQRPINKPPQQQRPTNRPPQQHIPLTTLRPPNVPTSSPSTSRLNTTQTSQRPRPGLNQIDVQTKNPNLSMAAPTKKPINSTQTIGNVINTVKPSVKHIIRNMTKPFKRMTTTTVRPSITTPIKCGWHNSCNHIIQRKPSTKRPHLIYHIIKPSLKPINFNASQNTVLSQKQYSILYRNATNSIDQSSPTTATQPNLSTTDINMITTVSATVKPQIQITGKEPTSIKEPNKESTPVIQVASFNLGGAAAANKTLSNQASGNTIKQNTSKSPNKKKPPTKRPTRRPNAAVNSNQISSFLFYTILVTFTLLY